MEKNIKLTRRVFSTVTNPEELRALGSTEAMILELGVVPVALTTRPAEEKEDKEERKRRSVASSTSVHPPPTLPPSSCLLNSPSIKVPSLNETVPFPALNTSFPILSPYTTFTFRDLSSASSLFESLMGQSSLRSRSPPATRVTDFLG